MCCFQQRHDKALNLGLVHLASKCNRYAINPIYILPCKLPGLSDSCSHERERASCLTRKLEIWSKGPDFTYTGLVILQRVQVGRL